jgi:hypothetical protein
MLQLLIVPVVDNTATSSGERYASWRENAETAWLPADHMIWFRDHYLPKTEDRVKWDNSPIFAPDDLVSNAPRAWIAVAEMDILRDEGIAYGEKLKKAGVGVTVKLYEKAPHPIIVLDGTYFKLDQISTKSTDVPSLSLIFGRGPPLGLAYDFLLRKFGPNTVPQCTEDRETICSGRNRSPKENFRNIIICRCTSPVFSTVYSTCRT